MILKTVAFILAIGGPTAHASVLATGIDVPIELARRDKTDEEKD